MPGRLRCTQFVVGPLEEGRYKECSTQLEDEIDIVLEYAKTTSLAVPGKFKVCICSGVVASASPCPC